ncbi:MAG: hypothetical protein LRZ94_00315, partial [Candidatus Pacebacteria bacterium]|nr:hypothetical protein [Candidatus Paceibacterota bacterium]
KEIEMTYYVHKAIYYEFHWQTPDGKWHYTSCEPHEWQDHADFFNGQKRSGFILDWYDEVHAEYDDD